MPFPTTITINGVSSKTVNALLISDDLCLASRLLGNKTHDLTPLTTALFSLFA